MKSSEKEVARSFRLSKHAFEGLELAAREKNTTVNSVLREVVDQYVDYENASSRMRLIHVDATFLKFLTEGIPKEKMIEFAKSYANTIEGGMGLNKSFVKSVDGLINEIRIQCKYNSEKLVEMTHESKRIVIIVHEVGLNFSLFVANYYKTLFEAIGVKAECDADENAAVIKFYS